MLKARGIDLIPASSPSFFVEDTPTAVLARQVLGAVSEFEKATLVAKLAAARKRGVSGKCEGRESHTDLRPDVVALARMLARKKPKGGRLSLREPTRHIRRAGRSRRPERARAAVQSQIRRRHAGGMRASS
jgi:DNA invertase Pin-like site-specific DNA recombinase